MFIGTGGMHLCLLGDNTCGSSVSACPPYLACMHNKSNLRSTSVTLWSRICLRTLGFSSSFSILAMMDSASSRCWRALT